jgi:hypothetical protein
MLRRARRDAGASSGAYGRSWPATAHLRASKRSGNSVQNPRRRDDWWMLLVQPSPLDATEKKRARQGGAGRAHRGIMPPLTSLPRFCKSRVNAGGCTTIRGARLRSAADGAWVSPRPAPGRRTRRRCTWPRRWCAARGRCRRGSAGIRSAWRETVGVPATGWPWPLRSVGRLRRRSWFAYRLGVQASGGESTGRQIWWRICSASDALCDERPTDGGAAVCPDGAAADEAGTAVAGLSPYWNRPG